MLIYDTYKYSTRGTNHTLGEEKGDEDADRNFK